MIDPIFVYPHSHLKHIEKLASNIPDRYEIIPVICGDALHGVISPKSPALDPLVSLLESRRCLLILKDVGGPL